ncbi:MAG: RluA family pseudouridine synthase [Candidatus Magasanikbacteria bacterium]
MPKKQTIQYEGKPNERLDVFLSTTLGMSRTQAQKNIVSGDIVINNKPTTKRGHRLREGDTIVISEPKDEKIELTPSEIKKEEKMHHLEIVHETPDYIVVNKPAGILTHETEAHEQNTLASQLLKLYPEIKNVGDSTSRPGTVHRLDKAASGILVVARTQKMYEHLKKQFQAKTVKKLYTVLTYGVIEADHGVIDFEIDRGRDGRMVSRPKINKLKIKNVTKLQPGKASTTEFRVLETYPRFSLLHVRIHTGRTHQIRVHMLAYGHPVVGDKLYFNKNLFRKSDTPLNRLFLHASKLTFKDLHGEPQTFEAELPTELNAFLDTISNTATKKKKGRFILISAPSGGGKNVTIRELLKRLPGSVQLVTTTSRKKRKEDKEGVDYYFISREEFEKKIGVGDFVEFNEYNHNLYGTEWRHLNETRENNDIVFSQAEVNGKHNLDAEGISHVSIFLLPESIDILKTRIRKRGGVTDESLEKRMKIAEREVEESADYDLRMVNKEGKLNETVESIVTYLNDTIL